MSRKRKYTTHFKEVSSKYKLQTLYIGKDPFMLRLYDKKEELKTSSKSVMMYEYFANNGFDLQKDIFNVEFEIHRRHFKAYNIDTVDSLLKYAKQLFNDSMEAIRLIDPNTITKSMLQSANRYKAATHPLWEYLKQSYKLDEFLSIDMPLERIKRKNRIYTIENAIKEHIALARKFYIHGGVIDEMFYQEVLEAYQKSIRQKDTVVSKPTKPIITHETIYTDLDLSTLSGVELQKYLHLVDEEMTKENTDLNYLIKKHQEAYLLLSQKEKEFNEEFPF